MASKSDNVTSHGYRFRKRIKNRAFRLVRDGGVGWERDFLWDALLTFCQQLVEDFDRSEEALRGAGSLAEARLDAFKQGPGWERRIWRQCWRKLEDAPDDVTNARLCEIWLEAYAAVVENVPAAGSSPRKLRSYEEEIPDRVFRGRRKK